MVSVVEMPAADRSVLESMARSQTLPHRKVVQSKALLRGFDEVLRGILSEMARWQLTIRPATVLTRRSVPGVFQKGVPVTLLPQDPTSRQLNATNLMRE